MRRHMEPQAAWAGLDTFDLTPDRLWRGWQAAGKPTAARPFGSGCSSPLGQLRSHGGAGTVCGVAGDTGV